MSGMRNKSYSYSCTWTTLPRFPPSNLESNSRVFELISDVTDWGCFAIVVPSTSPRGWTLNLSISTGSRSRLSLQDLLLRVPITSALADSSSARSLVDDKLESKSSFEVDRDIVSTASEGEGRFDRAAPADASAPASNLSGSSGLSDLASTKSSTTARSSSIAAGSNPAASSRSRAAKSESSSGVSVSSGSRMSSSSPSHSTSCSISSSLTSETVSRCVRERFAERLTRGRVEELHSLAIAFMSRSSSIFASHASSIAISFSSPSGSTSPLGAADVAFTAVISSSESSISSKPFPLSCWPSEEPLYPDTM
mmetsp:Transcript_14903/g.34305  ORF Transcript_14903/g.34305 Transcript_14903/m.34305 type:complete len:310 (-) Transcript_14903:1529-2458(-)